MKRLSLLTLAFFSFISIPCLHAQMMGGAASGVNTALLKLFGKHNNFSVAADMQMLDASQKVSMSMDFTMSVLNGSLRADVDVGKVKGSMMTPAAVEQMKTLGMDRVTSIVRPDKNRMILIYPNLKSYVDMALPKEAADSIKTEPKIQKTALGKETIDGHPCVKSKVVMTDEKGKQQEIIVWDASDLKDFPVKVEMTEEGEKIIMQYKQIEFNKPTPKDFDAPAGYSKFDTMQALMMQKMGGALGK